MLHQLFCRCQQQPNARLLSELHLELPSVNGHHHKSGDHHRPLGNLLEESECSSSTSKLFESAAHSLDRHQRDPTVTSAKTDGRS